MPFESKSQLVACLYAQERSKHKKGKRSGKKWDCMESLRETRNFDRLPWKTGCKAELSDMKGKGPARASSAPRTNSGDVIHTGPRGGTYILKGGKKVYI
jgi:hypothetical protein